MQVVDALIEVEDEVEKDRLLDELLDELLELDLVVSDKLELEELLLE
jgi:hypothetical protein